MRKIKMLFSVLLHMLFLAGSVVVVGAASPHNISAPAERAATIDPLNAIIATAVVSVVGLAVFLIRYRRNHQNNIENYCTEKQIEKGHQRDYREAL